jgi:hypothetical protein
MVRNQRDETTEITGALLNVENSSLMITENATANVSVTNVAPAAVGTATISKWLRVQIGGVNYYVPMWT